jgi:hypothetical protein
MSDKKIVKRLFDIVAKQQQALVKIAQAVEAATPEAPAAAPNPSGDLKAAMQADVIDFLYGKGTRLIPGKQYAQVHYVKTQEAPGGMSLVVGLTVPPQAEDKWQSIKGNIEGALKSKYSGLVGRPLTSIVWRQ